MVYMNRRSGERIRFVKKGHNHHNHVCNSRCSIGDDYFGHYGHSNNHDNYNGDDYYDDYYDDWGDDSWGDRNKRGKRNNRNRNNTYDGAYNDGLNGKYHVREIDEYISINRTRYGLKAKRGNGAWVDYTQNRNRKNEYIDKKGNKYIVRSDNDLIWKNKTGAVSLNLKK